MTLEEWEQQLGRWATVQRPETGQAYPRGDAAEDQHQTTSPPPAAGPEAAPNASPNDSPAASPAADRRTASATPWLESIEQSAMACEFEVLLNRGQYPQGIEHARDALRDIHRLEDELSVYRPLSDFCTINRWAAERAVGVRYDVCRLLAVARDVSRETGRAFDITAGSLSEVWGFSRRQGRKPNDAELAEALQRVGSDLITVDENARTVQLAREGVKLNPGGIGKGYALDQVANSLLQSGVEDFLIHGGRSSVAARGTRLSGEATGGWWIALAHPLRWEEKLGRIRLHNQALGTSGAGKQFFHYQGVRYSHVIDPRSGWPAQGVLSATAICRSGTLADALATAFMVMGPDATRDFCAARPHLAAILVSTQPGSSRLSIERINVADEDWQALR